MANPKKILFWPDVYKEQGHWLPTLAWADYLNFVQDANQNKSFDIKYMGIADCHEIINNFPTTSPVRENLHTFPYEEIFTKTYPQGYTNACSQYTQYNTTYNSYVAGE